MVSCLLKSVFLYWQVSQNVYPSKTSLFSPPFCQSFVLYFEV